MSPEPIAPTEPALSTLPSETGLEAPLQGNASLHSTAAQKSAYVSSLPSLVTMQQTVSRIKAEKEAAEARSRELQEKTRALPPQKAEPLPPKPPEKFAAPSEEEFEEPALTHLRAAAEKAAEGEAPVTHIAPHPFKDDKSGKEKTHWFTSSVTGLGRMKKLAATPYERAIQANAEAPQNLPTYAPQGDAAQAADRRASRMEPQGTPPNQNFAPAFLPQNAKTPSLLSADRASAAAVLAASRQPLPRAAAEVPSLVPLSARTDYAENSGEELHTYRSDAQSAIRSQNVTLSQIASAENARAAKSGAARPQRSGAHLLETIGGAVLILAACVLIVFIFIRPALEKHLSSLPTSQSFLYVDTTKQVELSEPTRATLLADFQKAAEDELSIGLVSRFELFAPATATSTMWTGLSAQQFLSLVGPHAPDTLSISLQPQYVTGIYSYDGNQPFIVFKVDPAAYDDVFSAMLQWEPNMMRDLSPLFGIAPLTAAAEGTSTAASTSTAQAARSNAPSFMDATLDNYSVRAIPNAHGQIVLLWGFLNRSTLLIATNQETLQKVVSILTEAPTQAEPAE